MRGRVLFFYTMMGYRKEGVGLSIGDVGNVYDGCAGSDSRGGKCSTGESNR